MVPFGTKTIMSEKNRAQSITYTHPTLKRRTRGVQARQVTQASNSAQIPNPVLLSTLSDMKTHERCVQNPNDMQHWLRSTGRCPNHFV